MNLTEKVAHVKTREDFVAFLNALLLEFRTHPEEWENTTLADYLEAMSAWTEDAEGYYLNQGIPMPQQPSWKMLAEILLASKYYE